MSSAEFALGVARLVALAGNGHTTVALRDMLRGFNHVPLRMAWFADGLYVVRAEAPFAALLGAQVVSIDGRSAAERLAAVAPYLSGTPEHARSNSTVILESPELVHAIWSSGDDAH